MPNTNTITNKDDIVTLAYNDALAVDDASDLDIFGAPTTKKVSPLEIFQYVTRAAGVATTLADCLVATTGALTVTYSNGTAGVGATLTNAGAQAALSIDGRDMAVNDRVLVWQQASGFQNGVYTVTNIGSASTNWVMTRATDFDASADMDLGTCVSILAGSTLIGSTFVMYTAGTITVGTTSVLFRFYSSALVSTLNALSVAGTGNLIFNISDFSNITIPAGTQTLVASGGAASFTTLTTTGVWAASIGTGAATVKQSGSLTLNVTPVANITTGEDDLMTYSLPANTLVTTAQYLEFEVCGTHANNANSKVVKVYFGTTIVATITLQASLAGNWRCRTAVTRTGLSAQTWVSEVTRTATGGATAIANTSGSCTETETGAIAMKCTGEAVDNNDIVQTKATVKNYAG